MFVQLLATGGMAETDFGRVADARARNQDVRAFARRMVQDHGRANDQLGQLARAATIPIPAGLDPDHDANPGAGGASEQPPVDQPPTA